MKKYFKLALVIFLCTSLFFVSSYFYLNYNLKNNQKTVDEKVEDVPYHKTPESCGLLIELPDDNNILFYLDFDRIILYIINIEENDEPTESYVGYPIDYRCKFDYYNLSLFFDRMGGIDLQTDDGVLRFSGIQVCDMISNGNSSEVSFDVINEICNKISKAGLTGEDFAFLISNCDTNLTMPVCLYWQEFMSQMFSGRVFVNWEP